MARPRDPLVTVVIAFGFGLALLAFVVYLGLRHW